MSDVDVHAGPANIKPAVSLRSKFEDIARHAICDSRCEIICVWCLNEARIEWSADKDDR